MVEKSGVERSGVEKSGVEMSFNLVERMTFKFGSSLVQYETNYFWKNNKETQVFTIDFTRCGMHFLQRRQGIYRIFPSVVDLRWQVS